jgi:hypothetical protein
MRSFNGCIHRANWFLRFLMVTSLWLLTVDARSEDAEPAEFRQSRELSAEVTTSGFRRDLETGDLVQMVKISNRGNVPLKGPFHLILRGLEGAAPPRSSALQGRVRSAGPSTIEILNRMDN